MNYDDIAKLTGIPKSTLLVWKHRGKMPEPDYMPSGRIPLWNPETIADWWKERQGADR